MLVLVIFLGWAEVSEAFCAVYFGSETIDVVVFSASSTLTFLDWRAEYMGWDVVVGSWGPGEVDCVVSE